MTLILSTSGFSGATSLRSLVSSGGNASGCTTGSCSAGLASAFKTLYLNRALPCDVSSMSMHMIIRTLKYMPASYPIDNQNHPKITHTWYFIVLAGATFNVMAEMNIRYSNYLITIRRTLSRHRPCQKNYNTQYLLAAK